MARIVVPRSPSPTRLDRSRGLRALQLAALLAGTALVFSIVVAALFVGAVITTYR